MSGYFSCRVLSLPVPNARAWALVQLISLAWLTACDRGQTTPASSQSGESRARTTAPSAVNSPAPGESTGQDNRTHPSDRSQSTDTSKDSAKDTPKNAPDTSGPSSTATALLPATPPSGKPAPTPTCRYVGTRSEGWYDAQDQRLVYTKCEGKSLACRHGGTRSEGWYDGETRVSFAKCQPSATP